MGGNPSRFHRGEAVSQDGARPLSRSAGFVDGGGEERGGGSVEAGGDDGLQGDAHGCAGVVVAEAIAGEHGAVGWAVEAGVVGVDRDGPGVQIRVGLQSVEQLVPRPCRGLLCCGGPAPRGRVWWSRTGAAVDDAAVPRRAS